MSDYYLLYDDSCEVCRTSIDHVRKLDRFGLVQPVPLSNPDLPPDIELPPESELAEQLHLFSRDGRVWRGADAIGKLTSLMPRTRIWGWLLQLPVIKHLARPVYRFIARNRRSIGRLLGEGHVTGKIGR